MKTNSLTKLFLTGSLLAVAFGCQKKQPMDAPVAPPQAYESEDCTDPDECSEGAMLQIAPEETPAAVVVVESPVQEVAEPVAVEVVAVPAVEVQAEEIASAPALEIAPSEQN